MSITNTRIFSIIVPAYNAAASIRACLTSVCSQTYTNYEVWIIDGASSDNTVHIVKEFQKENPAVKFISDKDKGIYDAINKGIDKANGQWLLFLGADDQLYNTSVLANVAEKIKDTTAEMLYGNVKVVGELLWAKNGDIYDGPFTVQKLFLKNICHQSIFYSKNIFKKIGNYNIEYKTTADWDLNHRCFAYCRTAYLDEIISFFHAGGYSTESTNDIFMNRDMVVNLRTYHQIGFFNKLYKPYHWVFFNLSVSYLHEKRYFKSLYFLFFAIYYSSAKTGLLKNYLSILLRHRNNKQSPSA